MALLKKSEIKKKPELVVNEVVIKEGSGVFLMEGGPGRKEKNIKVFYHRPKGFNENTKILLVIPGAGRNGDSYRDAWINASEKFGVLILSPMYAESNYPFEAYHLGGVLRSSNLRQVVLFEDSTNIAKLDEGAFEYTLNNNPDNWIFNDFDRIFNVVKGEIRSDQST